MAAWIAAAALCVVLVCLWRMKKQTSALNQMLDDAIQGRFQEAHFDESGVASVESRMQQYLSRSALAQGQLERERAQVQALISDISHQTKTPIANVLLYTQLLAEQPLSDEGRACVQALEYQARKLGSLTQDLVTASRLETGTVVLHPEEGPLFSVIQAAAAQVAPKAQAKGITLELRPTELTARRDPKWLEEALVNLLDNAVKYTPADGWVGVRVEGYPLSTAILVEDNGPGIPEGERAKVFSRFYRGAAHTQTEGVGIGLYLVRQIAEGQGGSVQAANRRQGGACFTFFLPNDRERPAYG